MKENFVKPLMEVVTFNAEDIIQTSGCQGDCGLVCVNKCTTGDNH